MITTIMWGYLACGLVAIRIVFRHLQQHTAEPGGENLAIAVFIGLCWPILAWLLLVD